MGSRKTPTDRPGLTPQSIEALAQRPIDAEGLTPIQETAWMEVIGKMEEVYTDLLKDEVELEEKNAALEDAQRFIKSVLSSMSDLLIVCDDKSAIRQVNDAVCKLTGYTEDELQGSPLKNLIVAVEGDDLPRPFKLNEVCEADARLLTRNGQSDVFTLTCTARKDRRGRPAGNVITARPIGELRRAYAALEKAHADLKQSQQRMIYAEKMASVGRLVAGVAHELNNPISFVHANMNVLSGYANRLATYLDAVHAAPQSPELQALRRDLRIDSALSDLPPLIEGVVEGAERTRDIVKGLRRMSFSGAGEPTRIDVADIVDTALTWAQRGIKSEVEVHLSLGGDLHVFGRESQIQQVALNIIQNAFDAMRTAPKCILEVTSLREDDQILIRFRDHGPGIDEAHLSKIFEPFFTTKDIGEGTGLGLWVSFDIIKSHDGELTAFNHPDGGGVFELRLPEARPETSERPRSS